MAGKIELEDDIDIKLGVPAYYPIPGEEVPDISAMPYFCGNFRKVVKLKMYGNTVLKFKVGGLDRMEIRGRVKRPDNTLSQMFRIKEENGNARETVETKCNVEIKGYDADDVGSWYLIIWYTGRSRDKASERRTVIV